MGTPADKLTYLNETKKDLKQAINSLGGDIDDNTTFRDYTETLHDLYDNAPKIDFQEGTSITLTDCIKAKIDFDETSDGKEIACIGQAEQATSSDPSPSNEVPIQWVTGNQEVSIIDENTNTIATYPLSLGTMKMCGIGDNRDYFITDRTTKKWYKRKAIEVITYDGTETGWGMDSLSGGRKVFEIINNDYKQEEENICLCNYFKSVVNGAFSYMEMGTCRFRFPVPDTGVFFICTDVANSVSAFKTWLSTHNVIVAYILGTPIDIEITDTTLKSQLENWYNAQTIEGTTTINVSGNLPMIIKARALTEVQAKATGTLAISENGTYDVSTYEDVDVDVAGQAPSGTDVIFYDYDGSVAYSYSKSDFLALTSMPANPTHTGLTSQGWNWSLADAKTYVTTYGKLNIGQMYVTDNGETRVYIELDEALTPYLGIGVNGTCTIDWGDGNTENVSGNNIQTSVAVPHTYASAGSYVLKIIPNGNATFSIIGSNGGSKLLYKNGTNKGTIYCSSIKKIEIGTNITSFGGYALQHCHGLESITIPNNITTFGYYAFSYCFSLKTVIFPDSVISLGNSVCSNCRSLKHVAISNGITRLESYAFADCSSLEDITIPSTVTYLGPYAFKTCASLKSITIPIGITTIQNNTFDSCSSVEDITIPSGVTEIGGYAFQMCYALKHISIPDTVTKISSYAFYYCYSLKSITIPSGVTRIESYVFENCYSLENVTIPSGVTYMGSSAFKSCNSLKSINIPNGVTDTSTSLFRECYSLTNITGLGSLTGIATYTFSSCYSMSVYDFSQCASVPRLANANAFSDIPSDCQILVPSSLYNDWVATSPWNSYASRIVAV